MDPRVSFITLAVADLDATRTFYVDGLGWPTELDVPGEVLMIKVGERLVLSLWSEAGFEAEVGPIRRGRGPPRCGARSIATGAATPATSPIPTATGGRSPGTPGPSA